MLFLHILTIFVLSLVMGRSARRIARSIRRIGVRLAVSEFTIAFVFLGLATSMPEISVAVFSAYDGAPGLSLGNLLGANVVVLSLVAGIATVLAGRLTAPELYRGHVLSAYLLITVLPVAVVLDGRLSRLDGLVLIGAYVSFLAYLYRQRKTAASVICTDPPCGPEGVPKEAAVGVAAACILLAASYFLVRSALVIASGTGVPPVLIGLLVLGVGTNLPELTIVFTQARGKGKDIVLGDLFGSVLVNTPTLGLLALLSPFTIERTDEVAAAGAFLCVLVAIFGAMFWTGRALTRREGFVLIGLYGIYVLRFLI